MVGQVSARVKKNGGRSWVAAAAGVENPKGPPGQQEGGVRSGVILIDGRTGHCPRGGTERQERTPSENNTPVGKGTRRDRLPGSNRTATPHGARTRPVAGSVYHHKSAVALR